MVKSSLKNKDFIPTEVMLEKFLGERFVKYRNILNELLNRKLSPEMYWYGPSSGWAPRFCIGEITICGIYLAQNPLMGLIGIGDRISDCLDHDVKLDPRSRVLYKIATKKGPLKWVEVQLNTDSDLDIFLSLIDGKLRALFKAGILLQAPSMKYYKKPRVNIKELNHDFSCGTRSKKKALQVGPSKFYNIKTVFAAGKG
jgi:hypothetical protein